MNIHTIYAYTPKGTGHSQTAKKKKKQRKILSSERENKTKQNKERPLQIHDQQQQESHLLVDRKQGGPEMAE